MCDRLIMKRLLHEDCLRKNKMEESNGEYKDIIKRHLWNLMFEEVAGMVWDE